jgi:hypothetical protein
MRNLTLTIHFCDISQSFVSVTKYENTSTKLNVKFPWPPVMPEQRECILKLRTLTL